jgi:hypothetical protein
MKVGLLYELKVKYTQKISRKRLQFLKISCDLRPNLQSHENNKALITIEMRLII